MKIKFEFYKLYHIHTWNMDMSQKGVSYPLLRLVEEYVNIDSLQMETSTETPNASTCIQSS